MLTVLRGRTSDVRSRPENAVSLLIRYPLTGSLRFAYELEIPELRSWSLKKFPYMIFYLPNDEHLDIWRVLHTRRDIPASSPRQSRA